MTPQRMKEIRALLARLEGAPFPVAMSPDLVVPSLRDLLTLVDEQHAENSVLRACVSRPALEALSALIDATGTGNVESPWLGVAAGVALLKIDAEKYRALEANRGR